MDIINGNNIDHKKILFSKPTKFENKYKIKVFVYDEQTKKINKLCLITPMFELNINWKSLKYQSFKINLDPLYGNILDFYNLITKIEDISLDELIKYFGDCTFKSIISELTHTDDLFIDSDLFTINVLTLRLLKSTNVFDINGKKTIINDFNMSGQTYYKFLLELTELWYDFDTKTGGCNFNITQIKHFPAIYDHDFITNDNQNININTNINTNTDEHIIQCIKGIGKGKSKINYPPPPPKANINIISTDINNTVLEISNNVPHHPPKAMTSLLLDPTTLQDAIAKLKKRPI